MSIISKPSKTGDAPNSELVLAGEPKQRAQGPMLGTAPRANLMPPELGENQRKRAVRRGLRVVLILVVVVAALGVAGAWYLAGVAHSALLSANQQTTQLGTQLGKYSELRTTQEGIADAKAAQLVGGGQDIDWQEYIAHLQSTLPGDVMLTKVDVKGADPATPFLQSTLPLEQPRVAEITFTAETTTLPSIPDWIDRLSTLPGFADATPGTLNYDQTKYTATVTMHVDSGAYSYRFAPKPKGASK